MDIGEFVSRNNALIDNMRTFLLKKKAPNGTLFCYVYASSPEEAVLNASMDDPFWRDAELLDKAVIQAKQKVGMKRIEFVADTHCPTCCGTGKI